MTIINQSFFEDPVNANTEIIRRIEGYDISNLGATEKVGSMVVFEGGAPNKSQYRKFIIKTVPGQSDIDSLKEVLNRRLNHDEWPMPDLFLIDGGRPQVSAAKKVLAERGVPAALIGLAKGPERKRNDVILGSNTRPLLLWLEGHRKLLAQVRDEAHRFAITFHRARRAKRLLK
jgi:excinuclease ABC subunit C